VIVEQPGDKHILSRPESTLADEGRRCERCHREREAGKPQHDTDGSLSVFVNYAMQIAASD
jgi:hypothetical protein